MYTFNLPHQDFMYIAGSTIEPIVHYHNSDKPLNFNGMPEGEIDEYIVVWLASLSNSAVIDFYDSAMEENTFIIDHIVSVYGNEAGQLSHTATERDLLRREFKRPQHGAQAHKSWADKIEDCVELIQEREAGTDGE